MHHDHCEVAIIGAGPYGLAAGAHLMAAGIETRVFGDTMAFWRRNMPNGMKLRSPWRASTIADPNRVHTLDVFAQVHGIERTENLPLADFVRYGEWFQHKAVPGLDRRMIRSVRRGAKSFRLILDDESTIDATRVVVAMGLTNQEFRPPQFAGIPKHLVSHSSEVVNPNAFRGQRVVVIGRGQSACESAVLMNEAGADVELICRGEIYWIGREAQATQHKDDLQWSIQAILTAPSAIGPFPFNWLVDAPGLLHQLPSGLRHRISTRCLRAAASAWLRPRSGGIRVNPHRSLIGAYANGDRITLHLDNGVSTSNHVVLATGYRTDISKLNILAPELLRQVTLNAGYPVLSEGFESSVPGLHFVGSPAVGSFGPLPRFVAGAGYAAKSVTRAALAPSTKSVRPSVPRAAMQPQQQ
jgi:FAD-dependent urate hydroxylase